MFGGGAGEALYSELQCIIGNGHMGTPCGGETYITENFPTSPAGGKAARVSFGDFGMAIRFLLTDSFGAERKGMILLV